MKQVIVIRKDLTMRKGKMIAQACHGVLKSFVLTDHRVNQEWLRQGQCKISVYVESEQELLDIATKAEQAGVSVAMVTDAGSTEVEPGTKTCVVIGPADNAKIDPITGHLKLL